MRDNYAYLSHGAMCRDCGVMVGDTERHDRWHERKDDQRVPYHTHPSLLDPIGPSPAQNDRAFRERVERTVKKMLPSSEHKGEDG